MMTSINKEVSKPAGGRSCCSYYQCTNKRSNKKGLRLYRFPKMPALRKLWLECCGNPKLLGMKPEVLTEIRAICEDHFRPEDVLPSGRLMNLSVPIPYDNRFIVPPRKDLVNSPSPSNISLIKENKSDEKKTLTQRNESTIEPLICTVEDEVSDDTTAEEERLAEDGMVEPGDKETNKPQLSRTLMADSSNKVDAHHFDFSMFKDLLNKLESVSEKFTGFTFGDSYDQFGVYLASLLRKVPLNLLFPLKKRLVHEIINELCSRKEYVEKTSQTNLVFGSNIIEGASPKLNPVHTQANTFGNTPIRFPGKSKSSFTVLPVVPVCAPAVSTRLPQTPRLHPPKKIMPRPPQHTPCAQASPLQTKSSSAERTVLAHSLPAKDKNSRNETEKNQQMSQTRKNTATSVYLIKQTRSDLNHTGSGMTGETSDDRTSPGGSGMTIEDSEIDFEMDFEEGKELLDLKPEVGNFETIICDKFDQEREEPTQDTLTLASLVKSSEEPT